MFDAWCLMLEHLPDPGIKHQASNIKLPGYRAMRLWVYEAIGLLRTLTYWAIRLSCEIDHGIQPRLSSEIQKSLAVLMAGVGIGMGWVGGRDSCHWIENAQDFHYMIFKISNVRIQDFQGLIWRKVFFGTRLFHFPFSKFGDFPKWNLTQIWLFYLNCVE